MTSANSLRYLFITDTKYITGPFSARGIDRYNYWLNHGDDICYGGKISALNTVFCRTTLFDCLLNNAYFEAGTSLPSQRLGMEYKDVLTTLGVKNVGREPRWCRLTSEYRKALASLLPVKKAGK